jgi:oligopeptide/dipeptide ABC transporter ATP-binding protein
MNEDILTITNLNTIYKSENGNEVNAIRSLNLNIRRGETLALVGESGSGKSTLGLSILNLIDYPNRIEKGKIIFHDSSDDISILDLDNEALRKFRWRKISVIFQSAMNVLNPVMRIEDQFKDTFEAHEIYDNYDDRINKYLTIAGLGDKVRRLYPHELSGGMKQRVSIALALSCEPELLIADEPTTALDVVVQREILYGLNKLKEQLHLTIIFITHDLSVASAVSDRIGIFYAGRIIEIGSKNEIIHHSAHPYSKLLLSSIISLNTSKDEMLATLEGSPPDLGFKIDGCSFYDRCPIKREKCLSYDLLPVRLSENHYAECIRLNETI